MVVGGWFEKENKRESVLVIQLLDIVEREIFVITSTEEICGRTTDDFPFLSI